LDWCGLGKSKFDELLAAVNKKYDGKYITIGSDEEAFAVGRIPTEVLAIDSITYGGLPEGRIIIFWGDWSSGKTFTALKAVKRAQNTCRKCRMLMADLGMQPTFVGDSGKIIVSGKEAKEFIERLDRLDALVAKKNDEKGKGLTDTEDGEFRGLRIWQGKNLPKEAKYRIEKTRTKRCPKCGGNEGLAVAWAAIEEFDPSFADMVGVDRSDVLVIRSETAEQVIDISAEVLRTGQCDLMVFDSIAMMTPQKEIEESAEKWQQGLAARLVNKALRRWASGQTAVDLDETGPRPTIILINQVREKIGVFYGCPDVLPCGKGQGFANSLTLKFHGGKYTKLEDTGETLNRLLKVKVEKSKVCPPNEEGEFVIWLHPHEGNDPGSTSEPQVLLEVGLREGAIGREKGEYDAGGKPFKTQTELLAAMTTDNLLADAVRGEIIRKMNERRMRHA